MKNLQNLNSLTKRFYRKSSMYHLNLTTELDEIIIGCLLGDLSAEKKKILILTLDYNLNNQL